MADVMLITVIKWDLTDVSMIVERCVSSLCKYFERFLINSDRKLSL
jgi:hypothetical protein